MDRCEDANCYWALVHISVVLAAICGVLEFGAMTGVWKRYLDWCTANFAPSTTLTPPTDIRFGTRCFTKVAPCQMRPRHNTAASVLSIRVRLMNKCISLSVRMAQI